MKTVIFDLDGTLADTSGDLIAAANACFEARGLGPLLDAEADKLTAFHGGRAMLRLGFSRVGGDLGEEAVAEDYPRLLDHYEDNIDRHTTLYPGCEAMMQRLQDKGFRLGVCTNKPERLAEKLIRNFYIRGYISSLIGPETVGVAKPAPEPYLASVERAGGQVAQSVLIGDTETDVKTARAAGVPVVLVAFGPEGDGISRLAPDAMLAHFDDLEGVLERIWSKVD